MTTDTSRPGSRVTEQVFFSGRVQGVGFRYTTRDMAKRHPVTGYVKNLPDGRVELLAQGTEAAVALFVDSIVSHFRANLQGVDRRHLPDSEEFARFEVRF